MKYFRIYFFLFSASINSLISAPKEEYVVGHLQGQLGNQMFIIAATVSLALDHNAFAVFPGFLTNTKENIPLNYEKIFFKLNTDLPRHVKIKKRYREPHFHFAPIPYQKNMELIGFFQSDKYFSHHDREIKELFAPSPEITRYLHTHYRDVLTHPKTVAIHARSYLREDPTGKQHITLGKKYFEKAISLFPSDSLFLVFSNDISWCKQTLAGIHRTMIFIEKEPYYCDFYLMSLCKHNIISNSSFSWWAAYLNPNPDKIVVGPDLWFNPSSITDTWDLKVSDWIWIK